MTAYLPYRAAVIQVFNPLTQDEIRLSQGVLRPTTDYGNYKGSIVYRDSFANHRGHSFQFSITQDILRPYHNFNVEIYNTSEKTANLFVPDTSNIQAVKEEDTFLTAYPCIVRILAGYRTAPPQTLSDGYQPRIAGLHEVCLGEIFYFRSARVGTDSVLILYGITAISRHARKNINVTIPKGSTLKTTLSIIEKGAKDDGNFKLQTEINEAELSKPFLAARKRNYVIKGRRFIDKIKNALRQSEPDWIVYFHINTLHVINAKSVLQNVLSKSDGDDGVFHISAREQATPRKNTLVMLGVPEKEGWDTWDVSVRFAPNIQLGLIGNPYLFIVYSKKARDFFIKTDAIAAEFSAPAEIRGALISVTHSFTDSSAETKLKLSTTGLPIAIRPVQPFIPYLLFKDSRNPLRNDRNA